MSNSAPNAEAVSISADEDDLSVIVTPVFTDPDAADVHTFSLDLTGTQGVVTNNSDGTFSYDPSGAFEYLAAGESATDTFSYTVDDGNGGTATETVTVTITGQNDAPVAVALALTASEDAASVTFTPVFSDADTSDTHGISFDLGFGGSAGLGLSDITDNGDGSYTYTSGETYDYLAVGESATETFSYTVYDGQGGTSTATATVTIEGENDDPVASAAGFDVFEDGGAAGTGGLTLTDLKDLVSDADVSDVLIFTYDTSATLGSVTGNSDGTFSYDPSGAFEYLAAGESATDTFSYTVDDGNGGTATETVTVTITGQNDAPVAVALALTASEDAASVTFTPVFSDADTSDTHGISFDLGFGGSAGLGLSDITDNGDGSYTYTSGETYDYLAVGESATETFSYTVYDGQGGTSTATATVTIEGENDDPVASALTGVVDENSTGITISAIYSDVDASDTHTFAVDSSSTFGVVTNNGDGTFIYDPNGAFDFLSVGEIGTDTFSYTVDDGNGGKSTALATVRIVGGGGGPVKLTASDGEANDYFGRVVGSNEAGTIVVGAYGDDDAATDAGAVYVYSPNSVGSYDEVKLTPSDGTAGENISFFSVNVNNAGVVVAGGVYEDGVGNQSGAVYVYAPNSDGTYSEIKLTASDGQAADRFGRFVDINESGVIAVGAYGDDGETGSVYVYTPNGTGGYVEQKLTASDRGAGDLLGTSVSITESGVILAGAFKTDDGASNEGSVYIFTPDGNGGYVETNLTPSDGDVSDYFGYGSDINDSGVIVASAIFDDDLGASSGSLYVFSPDGNGGYTETKLLASDGAAGDELGREVVISNSGVVVAGAFGDDDDGSASGAVYVYIPDGAGGYSEIKLNAFDGAEGDQFGRAISIDNNNVITVGSHLDDDNGASSGSAYVFTPRLDGTYVGPDGTVYGDAGSSNAAPEVRPLAGAVFEDGEPIVFSADFTDADLTDSHFISFDDSQILGTASLDGVEFSYDPSGAFDYLAVDESATETFSYTVYDGQGGTSTATATVTIEGENDDPVASALTGVVDENSTGITISAIYSDVDASDTHTFAVDSSSTFGVVTNNGDGTFIYDPNGAFDFLSVGEIGTDTFSYTVDDGNGGKSTALATVRIVGGGGGPVKLTASDGEANDYFGRVVGSNEAGTIVVGAYGDDDAATDAGAVYVYSPNSVGSYDEVKLTPSDGTAGENISFFSVNVNNAGVVVAGGVYEDGVGNQSGAVYVYAPNSDGTYSEIKLTASDGQAADRFGRFVDINESGVIAVGAYGDDGETGSVYVYTPNGTGGYVEQKLTASDRGAGDLLGTSVSITESGVILAGAFKTDDGASNEGSVYIFTPDGNGGYVETNLTPSDGDVSDYFGYGSDINDSGVIVASAIFDDDLGASSGSLYVFSPDGNGGYTETKLLASDGAAGDELGREVVISNSGVVVAGAFGDDDDGSASGAVYVYIPDGAGGYSEIKLNAFDGAEGDQFGRAISIDNNNVITVGSHLDDDNGASSGSAYVFTPRLDGTYVGPDGTVYGDAGAAEEQVTGTDNGETMTGGAADDVILAAGGDDAITGGLGSDNLTGGSGDDLFHFSFGDTGHDTITDFVAGAGSDDEIEFESGVFSDLASVLASASDDGTDTTIMIDVETSVLIQNVVVSSLHQDDFRFV
ncbi:tandem-95 repeat protein [Roseibium polysiphoniae]|uniref:Tandem-95 repeat protein n=1 Tax=Roseibium polysiphoniae TaxID=2571221 RepID=A0A944GTK1_9HYPH|nr:Ig-like domain-containing protein [Roseibium polysiphoniae]MBS8260616.1 tandem-95 repeat protein [Roseibium polysiphoniae]